MLLLGSVGAAELDEAPHQGWLASGCPDPGGSPLAEEGVLDRDGGAGEFELARRGWLLAGFERLGGGQEPGHVGDRGVGVDEADRGLADVDDRGHVRDRFACVLDPEEVRNGVIGLDLARRLHGDLAIVVVLQPQPHQPGHHDLAPRRRHERPRSLDPVDRPVADEEIERRPDHRARDAELFFDLALGGKAGSRLPSLDLQHHLQRRGKLEIKRYIAVAIKPAAAGKGNIGRSLGPARSSLGGLDHASTENTFD